MFVGSGAPKGKELDLPGRQQGAANIHIGIDWLESVAFKHLEKIGNRVLIIGVGNTAMDCCRSSLRLGATDVKVMARKPRQFFKASEWELEDAESENVEIVVNHAPKSFVVENGRLAGMLFDQMEYELDARGRIVAERVIGEAFFPADDVILAIGQENAFPWIEDDLGLEFDKWHVPVVDKVTFQSTRPEVFFGGDSAFGPKNIIWAVEHGHQAAISIHNFAMGQPVTNRLPPTMKLSSRKMGLHEWSYKNDYNPVERRLVPHVSLKERFKQLDIEVELGFDAEQAAAEVQRCLNCDVQTVFEAKLCIECDACIDICPTDCLTITRGGEEAELATRLKAPRASPEPAALRLRSAQADRPRHGQGRGPLRALRTLRRALPDGGLGHAEVQYPPAPRDRSQMAKPATAQDRVNDFVVKLANVNGTGSASANTLLMKAIFRMGVPVMGKNYFPSNIQGLPTWYEIRVTKHGYVARSGRVDLMVAMNAETYHKDVREVSPGGFLIYDSTWPRASVLSREDIVILGVPFAKICNENFVGVRNRILMKNIMYAGALAALLEIDVEVIRQLLTESYSKKPALVDANMKAVQLGFDYAKQHLPCPLPLRIERMNATAGHVMIDGNTAAGLGAVYAGATVGPWYPITPSTSLMDAFKSFCSKLRVDPETGKANYAVIQAEDELSAIGMVLGANWNGARAFTATSGPGISLMSEFIGLAYYAEIPAVIFDIQRVGPSTGMPTRTQQCDILLCAYASHGDTKHVLLFPSNPEECFYMTVQAFDLAERLQTPVFVLSDLDIGMNDWMCPELKWDDSYRPDRGKVLNKEEIEALPKFQRYLDRDDDGIPYRTLPGVTPKGAYFTRGSGHNQYGGYTEDSTEYQVVLDRLLRKFKRARTLVPAPVIEATGTSDIGLVAVGSSRGAVNEARDILAKRGIPIDYMRIKAFPFTQGSRGVHGLAREDLRGRAEPRRAAALAAHARDGRAQVEAALDPALQRAAHDLEGDRGVGAGGARRRRQRGRGGQ